MAKKIQNKFIGDDQVSGSKILLSNAEFIRAKKLDGSHKNVWRLNASDKIEFTEAPLVSIEGTEASSLQTKNQLSIAIAVEEGRALAAEAALQSAISAAATALQWKPSVLLVSEDPELRAAVEGDLVSAILPFLDDETPTMNIADIAAGHYLLAKNGASSKLMKVYDDAGTLKITFIGVQALSADHTFIVRNDLIDAPAAQEGRAIYTFTGSELIKIGDFDWGMADGIDLSPSYVSTTGVIVVNDSVQTAISKLVGNLAAEVTRASNAETLLQSNINAEAARAQAAEAALQSAIDAETLARSNADIALQSDIDSEISRATAAEFSLDARLDTAESEIDALQAADIVLDSRIDALEGLDPMEYKGVYNASTNSPSLVNGTGNNGDVYRVTVAGSVNFGAGLIEFAIGDKVVYNGTVWEKWDMTDAVSSVNTKMGAVVLDASDIKMLDGLTTVESKLNSLQSEVDAAEVSIAAETGRATAAEFSLDARLDTAESEIDTLQIEMDAVEAKNVEQDGRLNNLEIATANWHKIKKTLIAADITAGFVDLAHTALPNSVIAFVDRLGMHKDEDFTISVVGGFTRITFAGDMLANGSQGLDEGDSLFFTYQY